jgi:hypothetical protein
LPFVLMLEPHPPSLETFFAYLNYSLCSIPEMNEKEAQNAKMCFLMTSLSWIPAAKAARVMAAAVAGSPLGGGYNTTPVVQNATPSTGRSVAK